MLTVEHVAGQNEWVTCPSLSWEPELMAGIQVVMPQTCVTQEPLQAMAELFLWKFTWGCGWESMLVLPEDDQVN